MKNVRGQTFNILFSVAHLNEIFAVVQDEYKSKQYDRGDAMMMMMMSC